MALPEMLSAMRQLILDDIPVVDPFEARISDYRTRFPKLSSLEVEDLAKMPRDRLSVYTTSIFSAQSKMLQRNLQFTFALFGRAWNQVYGEDLCAYGLVRKIHAKFPWKSTDAWIVARNLIRYVQDCEPAIVDAEPALLDSARFECLTWEMRKALNDLPMSNQIEVAQLTEMSVDELLALRVAKSGSMRSLRTDFDVATARRIFQRESSQELPKITAGEIFQVGGRSKAFVVSWTAVPKELFSVIETTSPENFHVSNLAEGFLSGLTESTSEEEAFIKFVTVLVSLVEIGAFRLSKG